MLKKKKKNQPNFHVKNMTKDGKEWKGNGIW